MVGAPLNTEDRIPGTRNAVWVTLRSHFDDFLTLKYVPGQRVICASSYEVYSNVLSYTLAKPVQYVNHVHAHLGYRVTAFKDKGCGQTGGCDVASHL